MTIVGTRPEIIRLSRIISLLDEHCNHCLLHTGQNYDYELNQVFFDDLKIRKPNIFLNARGNNASETISVIIAKTDEALQEQKPDAVLILGDTNSSLAAIAAKKRKIPIFHMEAGNRSFDQRVPEEVNRRIVDHISDINLTYSSIAREYLLREGFPPDQVIKTGSPMLEVLNYYKPQIDKSNVLSHLNLNNKKYFLLSFHREENVDIEKQLRKIIEIINFLSQKYELPVVVSTHPRTRKQLDLFNFSLLSNIKFLKPLGFFDYIKLQQNSKAVLSDSGTITEESSILNFPALNIRESHERPEGMEEAAVMMVGLELKRVAHALEILDKQASNSEAVVNIVNDYNIVNVSEKILKIILSYTDYVNRVVWRIY